MKVFRFLPGDEIPGFDSALLASQTANEHLSATEGEARCSLWWDVVPKLQNERLGVIGHFQADSLAAGSFLLERAAERLRENDCTLAVGPMDGNTWRRYRVLTERGAEPSFFMEPDNPDFWSIAFETASFSPLASYSSSLVTDLSRRDPRAERARKRLQQIGVRIRHLDPDEFEEELRRIYQVSIVSFTRNYLYTEVSEAAFLSQYLPYKQGIVPELVLLAEQEDDLWVSSLPFRTMRRPFAARPSEQSLERPSPSCRVALTADLASFWRTRFTSEPRLSATPA
jgi:hypothetical protein